MGYIVLKIRHGEPIDPNASTTAWIEHERQSRSVRRYGCDVLSMADVLSALETFLGRSGAAIVPVLHPGIDESEVRSLLAGVGLRPTADVAVWFRWHDGAGERGMASKVIELVPGGEFYDLAYLCGAYLETRSIAEEVASMPGGALAADDLWRTSWFPLLRLFGKGYLAVDLSGGDGSMSPVHVVWHDSSPEDRERVAWSSIEEFVGAVIGRFETGFYSVDSDGIVRGPTIDFPDQ